MEIFRSIEELPRGFGPSVVTIGNFDGVHRGHKAILADVIDRARTLRAKSVAVTFDPHPVRVLRPESPLRLIAPMEVKLALLAETGIDAVLALPFTKALSQLSAEEFSQTILRDALGAVEVHEGENFRFGKGAKAGVNDLISLGERLGFEVRVHPPMRWRGMPVSSSGVRAAIAEGDMRNARRMLGRPFEIISTPAPGRGYGSRYTVPTINLAPYDELTPANGVYITCFRAGNQRFDSVTNVGNRPTFGQPSFAIETHLLDFAPFPLEETTEIRLTFLERLRPEIAWPSPEALKEQIGRDVQAARHYFGLYHAASKAAQSSS
jgi:riboflavin kinase/FMN adenylyltransferase